ncbi:MAG: RNA polymerase sigma factor [Bryobacteraceae bacterium]
MALPFGDYQALGTGGEIYLTEINPDGCGSSRSLENEVAELFASSLRGRLYQYLLIVLRNPAEAEDAAQECFLKLYRHRHMGNMIDDPNLWIFRVAHNLALDKKKSAQFSREVEPPSWSEVAENHQDPSPSPEQGFIQRERYEAVRAAMSQLTDQQKQVLYLRAEGFGYREIAEVLALSMPAVAAHVRRGIEKIKVKING